MFKSLLFWLAWEVSWLAIEVLSPCWKQKSRFLEQNFSSFTRPWPGYRKNLLGYECKKCTSPYIDLFSQCALVPLLVALMLYTTSPPKLHSEQLLSFDGLCKRKTVRIIGKTTFEKNYPKLLCQLWFRKAIIVTIINPTYLEKG